ncbi:MAG: FHA domain-containing protein [Thermoanaerobaculia bacterium]
MRLVFGDLAFDTDERMATRGGEPVHLSPKAFDLLALLVRHGPRAVRKPEILDALWPDVVVEEANVRNLVAEVRAALGADAARAVVTLPRVGYAFRAGSLPPAAAPRFALFVNGREHPLPEGRTVVGRDGSCGIVLHDTLVSRSHFRVLVEAGGAVVEDLGSRNGTWLNGRRVSGPAEVRDGDELRAGDAVLLVRVAAGGDRTTAVRESGTRGDRS